MKKNAFAVVLLCIFVFVLLCSYVFAMGEKPSNNLGSNLDIKAGVPTIVKIGADWCPPCRQMKAIFKEIESDLKDNGIDFIEINIDQQPDIARKYKANLIPTILFFNHNGEMVFKQVGAMPKEKLLGKLKELGRLK